MFRFLSNYFALYQIMIIVFNSLIWRVCIYCINPQLHRAYPFRTVICIYLAQTAVITITMHSALGAVIISKVHSALGAMIILKVHSALNAINIYYKLKFWQHKLIHKRSYQEEENSNTNVHMDTFIFYR